MNDIFWSELETSYVIYLDNILVYLVILDNHYQHLKWVLFLLHQNQLYIKPSKCIFTTPKLEFCSHIISNRKFHAIPSKLDTI